MASAPQPELGPIHEEILEALTRKGSLYFCADPDERWAPYVGDLLDLGLLAAKRRYGYSEFSITEAGCRRRRQMQELKDRACLQTLIGPVFVDESLPPDRIELRTRSERVVICGLKPGPLA